MRKARGGEVAIMTGRKIDTRRFGGTGREVTLVGLGGEGILRTHGQLSGAQAVINEAILEGISYFDCARVYDGSEEYFGSIWSGSPDIRNTIFQASKSAKRDGRGALSDLELTLRTMAVSHLDLWQIHDVRDEDDIWMIEGSGGALKAFMEAKKTGKIRYIGVTGHHDPEILTKAVTDWPVDTVMLPVNPVEGLLGGFLDSTLSAARVKGLAVIGMKVLGAGHYVVRDQGITPELLIRYALSWNIDVAIVGCSSPQEVATLAEAGRGFEPLSPEQMAEVEEPFKPYLQQLAYYRGVV